MDTQPTTDIPLTDNRIFLKGQQLAEVLDVSPPSLSQAVKQGYKCGGYPVAEWAICHESGRIKGYEVPESLVSGERKKSEKRANPSENTPNKPKVNPNKGKKSDNSDAEGVTYNNYSLLPEGEDYVRPVGMFSLSSALKKALESDTPQSRAVISGLLAMLGAITGHTITDNSAGAGIGAGAGLGIAFITYKYFKPYNNFSQHPVPSEEMIKQMVNTTTSRHNQSSFLPN